MALPFEEHIQSLGFENSINKVLDGTSMLLIEYEPFFAMDGYPCQFTDIKRLR